MQSYLEIINKSQASESRFTQDDIYSQCAFNSTVTEMSRSVLFHYDLLLTSLPTN